MQFKYKRTCLPGFYLINHLKNLAILGHLRCPLNPARLLIWTPLTFIISEVFSRPGHLIPMLSCSPKPTRPGVLPFSKDILHSTQQSYHADTEKAQHPELNSKLLCWYWKGTASNSNNKPQANYFFSDSNKRWNSFQFSVCFTLSFAFSFTACWSFPSKRSICSETPLVCWIHI